MTTHTFDVVAFRTQFAQFANETKYPDAVLSGYFSMATCNINPTDNCYLYGDCLQLMLNLMTAHLAYMFTQANSGTATVGIKTSASVDKVSVSEAPPPFTSAWQYWLGKSPYGQQLLSMLSAKAAGGFYVGGIPEGDAFRKVYGVF